MSVSIEQVQAALKELIDPNTQKDFIATKSARKWFRSIYRSTVR